MTTRETSKACADAFETDQVQDPPGNFCFASDLGTDRFCKENAQKS